MTRLLLIMLGGAVGTGARYGIHTGIGKLGGAFPYGILVVNLLGCFLAGLLGALLAQSTHLREDLKLALTVGFLGGLTTFSAYSFDTLKLWLDQRTAAALMNVVANNVGCLLLAGIGYLVGTRCAA